MSTEKFTDYSDYAEQFSMTRLSSNTWSFVKEFLKNGNFSSIFDVGCGNGRNMYTYESISYGIDSCKELCNIAVASGFNVDHCSILDYIPEKKYNCVLCISMIQHIYEKSDRLIVLEKLLLSLDSGGSLLINIWTPLRKLNSNKLGQLINIPFVDDDKKAYSRLYYMYEVNEFTDDLLVVFEKLNITHLMSISSEINSFDNECFTIQLKK